MKALSMKSKLFAIGIYLLIAILFLLHFDVFSNSTLSKLNIRYSNATYFDNSTNYIKFNPGDIVSQDIRISNDNSNRIILFPSSDLLDIQASLSDVCLSNYDNDTVINIDSDNIVLDHDNLIITLPENVVPGIYNLCFICNNECKLLSSVNMDSDISFSVNNSYRNECISALCVFTSSLLLPLFVIIICALLPVAIILLINNVSWKSFLIISVCFCLLFAFILPYPFSELEHTNVYSSNRLISNNTNRYDDFNDTGYWSYSGIFNKSSLLFEKNAQLSSNYSYYKSNENLSSLNIPVLSYISSAADRISSLLSLSSYWSVILRRLFNIVLYIIVCTLSVYIIDRYKYLLYMLALSPLLLINVSSFASFPIAFSFVFLLFAICIRSMFDTDYVLKPLSIILLLLSVFMVSSYSLLLLLPFSFIVFCIPSYACKYVKKSILLWLYSLIVCGCIAWQTLILINNNSLLQLFTLSNSNSTSTILSFITDHIYNLSICIFNTHIPFANNSLLIAISLCFLVIGFILSYITMKQDSNALNVNKKIEHEPKYISLLISIVGLSYVIVGSLFSAFRSQYELFNMCIAIISLLSLLITIKSYKSSDYNESKSKCKTWLIYLVVMSLSVSCVYYVTNLLFVG